ncbi:MAG: SDR family oxidoreductase [Actinomycetes bacterium]|jgi:NAD(P)-dependent dehydrogenase (short-subunit alcohol dehydrogenase family)|nr:MAG: dehydrogenase [Actinomycetota bacterium]
MEIRDKVVVITGAGSGIGAAMARRFAHEEPRALVLTDLVGDRVEAVADEVGGHAVVMDVSDPEANRQLIESTEDRLGPIDLFCANAGYGIVGDEQTDPAEWDRMWQVNVMSHVHAARYLIPGWKARGQGYFLATVSAAGLLTNLKAAQYSVTKHAAMGFAEWLSITYGDHGIKVSALCPMGVRTRLFEAGKEFEQLLGPDAIDADQVAEEVVKGLADERFLILPHPEVAQFFQNKANDYERWLGGMRKLQRRVFPE